MTTADLDILMRMKACRRAQKPNVSIHSVWPCTMSSFSSGLGVLNEKA